MRQILGRPAVAHELDVEHSLVKNDHPGSRHHAMQVLEKVLVCVQAMSLLQGCFLIELLAMGVCKATRSEIPSGMNLRRFGTSPLLSAMSPIYIEATNESPLQ